ncbi:MAG: hypothetical protein L6R42_003568, partial [Xanthoria sp. 1 TBL-2021]
NLCGAHEVQLRKYWQVEKKIVLKAQTNREIHNPETNSKALMGNFMPTNTPHEVEIYVKDVARGSLPPFDKLDDKILYHPTQDIPQQWTLSDARLKKYFGICAEIARKYGMKKSLKNILSEGGVKAAYYTHVLVNGGNQARLSVPCYKTQWPKEFPFEVWAPWMECPLGK